MPWVKHERVAGLDKRGEVVAMAAPREGRPIWWSQADELLGLGDRVAVAVLLAEAEDGRQAAYRRSARAGDASPPWFGRRAWSMWPDYGGAGLWDEDGASVDAAPEDLEGLREDRREGLIARVQAWQSQFERRVSDEKGGPPFEWAAFNSCGSALGRALSDASGRLVVYSTPYEQRQEERALWIHEDEQPEGLGERERELARALSSWDEERALALIEGGAPEGELMEPGLRLAHICAHFGMERALRAALAQRPEAAFEKDGWGASVLDAAVFAADAGCVRALIEAGAGVEEPDADGLSAARKGVEQLRRFDRGEEAALAALCEGLSEEALSPDRIEALVAFAFEPARPAARAIVEREALRRGQAPAPAGKRAGRSI